LAARIVAAGGTFGEITPLASNEPLLRYAERKDRTRQLRAAPEARRSDGRRMDSR
jgi:hypothetical protein